MSADQPTLELGEEFELPVPPRRAVARVTLEIEDPNFDEPKRYGYAFYVPDFLEMIDPTPALNSAAVQVGSRLAKAFLDHFAQQLTPVDALPALDAESEVAA